MLKLQWAALAGATFLAARQFTFDTYRDQVVVITGGSRGLGFALASDVISRGAHVVLLARDAKELKAACNKLGEKAFAITCDVTLKAQLTRAIDKVMRDFGRIDTFIHNAGLISVGPFDSFTEKDFDNAINLHLKTAVYSVQILKPVLETEVANLVYLFGRWPRRSAAHEYVHGDKVCDERICRFNPPRPRKRRNLPHRCLPRSDAHRFTGAGNDQRRCRRRILMVRRG